MIAFRYAAIRLDGVTVRGSVDAADAEAARRVLRERGLLPSSVRADPARPWHGASVSRRDLANFLRGLARLLRAGVPLDRALVISDVTPRLRKTIESVRAAIREGRSLAQAMHARREIPRVAVQLIRAGERSGLAAAVDRAADLMDRDAALRSRVAAALIYPALLIVVGGAAGSVLVLGVLPRFVTLLAQAGNRLPWSTRTLLGVAATIRMAWPVLLAALLGPALFAWRWLGSAAGHRALLRVPIIGRVRLQLATARIAHAMGSLLQTGAPALASLAAAAQASGDLAVMGRIERAAQDVRVGQSLGAALARRQALDPQALELLLVAERSGSMAPSLAHAAILSEASADRTIDTLTRLIEPILIVMLGGGVGFVALALLQAMYALHIAS